MSHQSELPDCSNALDGSNSPTDPSFSTELILLPGSDLTEGGTNKCQVLFSPNSYLNVHYQREHTLYVDNDEEENKYPSSPKQRPNMRSVKPVPRLESGKIIRVLTHEVKHGEICAVGGCTESFQGLGKGTLVNVHSNDIDARFMQCERKRCPEHHTLSLMHLDLAIGDIVEGQVWMEWVGNHWRHGLYNWTRLPMVDRRLEPIKANISCPWPKCPNHRQFWTSTPFQRVKTHDPQPVPEKAKL